MEHKNNDMHITVYRRQEDGSWPTVGTTDIAVFTSYKSYEHAMYRAIIPFLQGRHGKVEIRNNSEKYGNPCITRWVNMQKLSVFI